MAARRIVAAQRLVGIDAELIYRGKAEPDMEMPTVPNRGIPLGNTHRIASRLVTMSNRIITRQPSVLFTPWGTSISTSKIASELQGAQIIHLHNIYNFIRIRTLLKSEPHVRIVTTLHDERLNTAGCHYSLGCDRFVTDCHPCPQNRLPYGIGMSRQLLLRQLSQESRFSIVTPSRWLTSQVEAAGFPISRISHIPNPIDPTVFSLKQVSERGPRKKLIVGVLPGKLEAQIWEAVRIANERLRRENQEPTIEVLTPSGYSPPDLPVRLVPAPRTESARAQFWSSADVGVSLTSADNFPNVVLESLAVGTPFITNDVGGAGEAIRASGGGVVIKEPSPTLLADQLEQALRQASMWERMGRVGAEGVRALYSPETVGSLYAAHYGRATG